MLGEALDRARFGRVHFRFWLLAGLGIMLDGFDFFIIGVANPLIAEDLGISDDIAATEATAVLDLLLPLGFGVAIVLVDRLGRVPLQIGGFAMMAIALCVLATSELLSGGSEAHLGMVVVGFALFNFFMNAGPNATTYALPAEVFPCELRAAGHGFAAAAAKLGAAIGVFGFPLLLDGIGEAALLFGVAGCALLGMLITIALRIEPKGRSLEGVRGGTPGEAPAEAPPHPVPP